MKGIEADYLRELRRPDLPASDVERILRSAEARRFHAIRLALARHRNTPRADALSLVETLFWRDLAHLSADARVHPEIRRAADTQLLRRVPEMAVAERIDLARTAGRGTLVVLRRDPDVRVVAAFLDNRFATEGDVVQAASQSRARPEALQVIAAHPRWSPRRSVREAVLRNPAVPDTVAEAVLDRLSDGELEALRHETSGPGRIRTIAQRVLARRVRAV